MTRRVSLAARNKTSVLPMRIREAVPDRTHAATGDDKPVSLAQSTMLPEDKMPVGSVTVLPVVIPRLSSWPHNQKVLPVPPVNPEVVFIQAVQGEVRQLAHTVVWFLAAAQLLQISRHVPAPTTYAPWHVWHPSRLRSTMLLLVHH